MSRRLAFTGICSATLLVSIASAQDRRTVWVGVYSSAQAARGQIAYASTCSRCHSPALEGDRAPSLVGDTFWRSWREDSLSSLSAKIDAMPPKTTAHRSSDANADLVAFILQANRFPAGAEDLAPNAEVLDRIRIIEKDGQGIPNFSLFRMGCGSTGEGLSQPHSAAPATSAVNAVAVNQASVECGCAVDLSSSTIGVSSTIRASPITWKHGRPRLQGYPHP